MAGSLGVTCGVFYSADDAAEAEARLQRAGVDVERAARVRHHTRARRETHGRLGDDAQAKLDKGLQVSVTTRPLSGTYPD
jgi:hypothetical protein